MHIKTLIRKDFVGSKQWLTQRFPSLKVGLPYHIPFSQHSGFIAEEVVDKFQEPEVYDDLIFKLLSEHNRAAAYMSS